MEEIEDYYNQDIHVYKKYLNINNINYKQLIKYFSKLNHIDDLRFDINSYYLPKKNNYGLEKISKNDTINYTYFVSCYQTTNAQFQIFLENSDYRCKYKYSEKLHNHPVTWVSWYDAIAYTKWLDKIFKNNFKNRKNNYFSNEFINLLSNKDYQISLLSEEEWLYAASSGQDIIYPWGNYISTKYCNYKTSKVGTTCPVGCYINGISKSGLFDLSGNTWEWLRTKWGPTFEERLYKSKKIIEDDRNNTESDLDFLRSMKGGSFLVENIRLKINFDDAVAPDSKDDGDGFRIGLVKIK